MISRDKARDWLARLLFAFVLLTIGFAWGRRTAPVPAAADFSPPGGTAETGQNLAAASKVIIYAAHMTFRCQECTQIEWFARELVEEEFAAELASGRIEFQALDYMRNPDFVRRYNVSSSVIVVSRVVQGREVEFNRLDEVWTKTRDRNEFFAYMRQAVRDYLDKGAAL